MQTHGPKRIYTPQSLEFWFARLEADWEGQFDASHVELGHNMYRDGEIREELELGASDTIIHRKIEKKEEYAVIEWDGDQIKVRSSSTDTKLANAIAVAGLHEIEELLVDEMTALLPGKVAKASPVLNGRQEGGENHDPKADQPARDLLLSFTTTADGLVFLAYWKSGRSRIPALGNTTNHPSATRTRQTSSRSRPTLVKRTFVITKPRTPTRSMRWRTFRVFFAISCRIGRNTSPSKSTSRWAISSKVRASLKFEASRGLKNNGSGLNLLAGFSALAKNY